MNGTWPTQELLVVGTHGEADGILGLVLADPHGAELPAWAPGAHISVTLPSGLIRQYSLCGDPEDRHSYRISVLRTATSRGGSEEIHRTERVGWRLQVGGPHNRFPLVPASRYVFIAGGIGITPLLPMLRQLAARPGSPPWSLLYGGQSLSTMAFRREIAELQSDEVTLWPQDTHGLPDLGQALNGLPPGTAVYCCGPEGLLHQVQTLVDGWLPPDALHTERFLPSTASDDAAGEPDSTGDTEFEVELARSGIALRVPADRTLLDAVREAAPAVPSSCEEGLCGTCETKVLEGTPDHRDSVLNEAERAAGATMMICVGRAQSARLVLDL